MGYASGKQAAAERASQLRKAGAATANTVILAVENFLYEVTEELWLEMSCLVLSDPAHNINLVTYSQATVVEARVVQKLKDGTPDNYPRQWSGFAVPVGRKLETRTHLCSKSKKISVISPFNYLELLTPWSPAGRVMSEELNVPADCWQEAVTGVHRARILLLAAESLAGMYRKALQSNVDDI